VAVSLLTGCNVCGIEIVEDRCRLATAVMRSLADWIVLACTSTPMCTRKACASIRAAALSRIPRAACTTDERGRPGDGYYAEEIEEVFGEECVCCVLECLNLDRLCDSGVTLRSGNVLLDTDLTEEEIAAADVIFCNNYRGYVHGPLNTTTLAWTVQASPNPHSSYKHPCANTHTHTHSAETLCSGF
jgi:hypothetical protein